MNVLMTADAVGGVWTYALELTRALQVADVRVTLAVLGPEPSAAQRAEANSLSNVVLRECALKLEWMDDPWDDVARSGRWLLDLARDVEADVVHLNGYAHAALPWRAPTLVVAHSCVCSWWRAVRGEDAPASRDPYRRAVTAGVRAAAWVVAPTRAMLDALCHHYGEPRRAAVVPNAVHPARVTPRPTEPLVVSVGRLWDDAKNLSALERVAPALPWPVVVAGDVTPPDGAPRPVSAVRAVGRLDARQVAAWLGRAAIFALPARYEPFGLAALEAALAGCALVLGDIATLREVWGDAAVFVPPDDHVALAAAIRRLIEDAPARVRLAARARARALELSPARMAEGYLDIYRGVTSRAGASAEVRRAAAAVSGVPA